MKSSEKQNPPASWSEVRREQGIQAPALPAPRQVGESSSTTKSKGPVKPWEEIEDIRMRISDLRSRLDDALRHESKDTSIGHDIVASQGALTCVLVTLYHAYKEMKERSTRMKDGLRFGCRGIGLDYHEGFCCFKCGTNLRHEGANHYMNNISAFVDGQEGGLLIQGMFEALGSPKGSCFVDFRPNYPHRVQFKLGCCDAHLPNLTRLEDLVSDGSIGVSDIKAALEFDPNAKNDDVLEGYSERVKHLYDMLKRGSQSITIFECNYLVRLGLAVNDNGTYKLVK